MSLLMVVTIKGLHELRLELIQSDSLSKEVGLVDGFHWYFTVCVRICTMTPSLDLMTLSTSL